MWLISTSRAEHSFFSRPEDVPGGYAILSHVWLPMDLEDTFQKLQGYKERCQENVLMMKSSTRLAPKLPTNPRDLVSSKIRAFLVFAEKDGYAWAWADTCCIDKTSSAELSEAINSMFRYYSLSHTCYVYLSDHGESRRNSLHRSQWHGRGWTLQELVAPKEVVFLSRSWIPLGTKLDLAMMLEEATGIPAPVLRFERSITDMSVAARMSWASKRKTTRVEDEAYCLFGLFGINMPTLYGEGSRAFYRLQEEIMKTSVDTSLFAWGPILREPHPSFGEVVPQMVFTQPEFFLLADSPSRFEGAGSVVFVRFSSHFKPDANVSAIVTHGIWNITYLSKLTSRIAAMLTQPQRSHPMVFVCNCPSLISTISTTSSTCHASGTSSQCI
ncbi:HET-domain-containing protein [Epithele typhae]|uniref:HET-domain-containing protein n=1 Tax=Epithele typhae TaxID=378194 RepID=UPI0020084254|nr:HET-domain-containing protein [Epithele typhae]KAH9924684.1 HET-domain-containing protein [Epithele typhae]